MNRLLKSLAVIAAFMLSLTALLPLPALAASDPIYRRGEMLNTVITIALYGADETEAELILDRAFALCEEYEALLSRTREGSDVARINAGAGSPVEVSDETLELLQTALYYAELTDGAFDPTVEPIVTLWDIMSPNPHAPNDADIAAALDKVDWRSVTIDGNNVLIEAGMGIDLGAIAKGYIADCIGDYLSICDISGAIINLGGNVLTLGTKQNGSEFTIGVQKPFGQSNEIIGKLTVRDTSVITSGTYERYFVEDGVMYHHIMDPHTGRPTDNGISSVTIITPRSVDGDALSTACFVLGVDKGIELVDSIPDAYAIYYMDDGSFKYSSGAQSLGTWLG